MKRLFNLLITATATFTLAVTVSAAKLNCETRVPGRGWVKVLPELNSQIGGTVVHLPRYGGWVTGRVAPGESFRWQVTASVRSEKRVKSAAGLDSMMPAVEANFSYFPFGALPAIGGTTIPKTALTPGTRFLVVARTEAVRFTVSLPIGKR